MLALSFSHGTMLEDDGFLLGMLDADASARMNYRAVMAPAALEVGHKMSLMRFQGYTEPRILRTLLKKYTLNEDRPRIQSLVDVYFPGPIVAPPMPGLHQLRVDDITELVEICFIHGMVQAFDRCLQALLLMASVNDHGGLWNFLYSRMTSTVSISLINSIVTWLGPCAPQTVKRILHRWQGC